ncbi:MAG: CPBP family glutamic-type intramembrane protease [Pseudomonadota bacterium]|nr:CPBP family glutamic-type intramembrane protease [Pseudomonadota bacterium]
MRALVTGELRHHLRDRVTVAVLVLGQGLLFPMVGLALARLEKSASTSADAVEVVLAVERRDVGGAVAGAANGPDAAVDGDLARLAPYVKDHTRLVSAGAPAVAGAPLPDATLHLSPPGEPFEAEIQYDAGTRNGMTARKRAEALAKAAGEAERGATFRAAGAVDPALTVVVEAADTVSDADRTLRRAASYLPALLMMLVASGGIYTALDVVTGERERRTIETLLTTAANRRDIAVAKFLVVLILVLGAAFVSLTSLYITSLTPIGAAMTGGTALPVRAYLVSLVLFLPLAATLAAILTAAAARVSDFKSGQVYAFPALVVPTGLAAVALLPDATLTPFVALIPITNLSVALKEVLLGTANPGSLLLCLVASTGYAAAALTLTTRWLSQEEVLLGDRGGTHRRLRGNFAPDALAVFVLGLCLFWFLAAPAQKADFALGIAFTQFALFLPLGLGAPAFYGLAVRDTLALRLPRLPDLAWGVVAGALCPLVGLCVAEAQATFLPMSADILKLLNGIVPPDLPLPVLLLLVSVAPALCEEMLFRGAIQGLLARSMRPWLAALVTAVAFGLFHFSLFRILPTAILGLLFGLARARTGSLVVPVIMHAMNNGLFVLLGAAGITVAFRPEMPLAIVGIGLVIWRMGR